MRLKEISINEEDVMKRNLCVICIIILLLITIQALISCSGKTEIITIIEIITIMWEEDENGYLQFCTNDPNYYNYYFYAWDTESFKDPMTVVVGEIKKISGYEYGGYGMLFCFQDENNFYLVLIDTMGYYTIWERNNGDWIEHIPWEYSSYLKKGYNIINKLNIEYNHDHNSFTISFNDVTQTTIYDSSFSGGCLGGFVEVYGEKEENFPDTPVDVRFKLINNNPPAVTINAPLEGITYQFGDTISFNGSGNDTEDGSLVGGSLVWNSDIDGQIGTGESFTRNDLSLGVHTITLTATDSVGSTGSDSISITVGIASLIAYYPFNGNANDESTNNYNGTVYGATLTTDRFGSLNSAYSFDGVDDHIDLGDLNIIDDSAAFSVSFWANISGGSDAGPTLIRLKGTTREFHYAFRSRWTEMSVYFGFRLQSCMACNESQYILDNIKDEWHHHVVIYKGGNMNSLESFKAYIDGVSVSFEEYGWASGSANENELGRDLLGSNYLDGVLDEVRIYSGILSDAKIQDLYNQ